MLDIFFHKQAVMSDCVNKSSLDFYLKQIIDKKPIV